ncbi:aldehyde dehydrogenase family protein [Erysipelothrix sp. HDW6C]|uniref:aldehyde dehydrogenase family protein n=1 Tax=Erysipelothrix sp. HDW6C TaxID=2714930 RepID=UPI00140C2B3F|nr:aldehyde dehydrogenase family protein [Erysipelothrix sp. HDW6C]QIK69268.1 aldehyde dehydrogenase family protein [Erysipelothrix sp. HDW6C]
MKKVMNWIEGSAFAGSGNMITVVNPRDEHEIASISSVTPIEAIQAIETTVQASKAWSQLTYKKRSEVIFNLRTLIAQNEKLLIETIVEENGKTEDEAQAEVSKAIELCEFATSIPSVISGRTQYASNGIEVKEVNQAIGVVAAITPFNFPLMVPMWTIPNALVCGNGFILKPSEKTPSTALIIAQLLKEAGLPDGVFTILQGSREIVDVICDHKDVDVVTFVGSTPVAEIVYRRATSNLKRSLALGGAKNHIIVTPEVDPIITAKEILNAGFGMSGQRCMAASTVLLVGENNGCLDELIKQSVNWIPGVQLAPLVSAESVALVDSYLQTTKGTLRVDGRKTEKPDKGYYIGGSIIEYASYKDMPETELFAPVLEVVHCKTLTEAIALQNESPYANGASIFTDIGENAMVASLGMSSGMIGVNIGVPVPRDPFSFGGLKGSKFGVGDITGYNAIPLFVKCKKITTKWNPEHKKDWMS